MTRCVKHRFLKTSRATGTLLIVAAGLAACTSPPPRPDTSSSTHYSAASSGRDTMTGDAQTRFAAALKLMEDGRRDEAITALQALSHDFPQFSGPPTDLGILYAQLHRRDAAIASFTQAINANPANVVALNWLGMLYREGGDFTRAEQSYRQALTARPDYAPAYLNLAILYDLSLHRPQDALTQYRNYQQRAAGKENPMVGVWIKEIEMASNAASGRAVAGAQK